jgi:AmiR/NasT family two-component response regulator
MDQPSDRECRAELIALRRQLCAAEATIASLEAALANSRRIGMAVGILMHRYRIPEDKAFILLARAGCRMHRKVRDVACDVVLTGDLPGTGDSAHATRRAG